LIPANSPLLDAVAIDNLDGVPRAIDRLVASVPIDVADSYESTVQVGLKVASTRRLSRDIGWRRRVTRRKPQSRSDDGCQEEYTARSHEASATRLLVGQERWRAKGACCFERTGLTLLAEARGTALGGRLALPPSGILAA
jgi:hypothetical protein